MPSADRIHVSTGDQGRLVLSSDLHARQRAWRFILSATLREVHCKDLLKARIHASDGKLGSLKDVYFDDEAWNTRYFVVDTGNWLQIRKVLVSPQSLASADTEHMHCP
jgi:hypothetical protein